VLQAVSNAQQISTALQLASVTSQDLAKVVMPVLLAPLSQALPTAFVLLVPIAHLASHKYSVLRDLGQTRLDSSLQLSVIHAQQAMPVTS
jgi:hypothetical protein